MFPSTRSLLSCETFRPPHGHPATHSYNTAFTILADSVWPLFNLYCVTFLLQTVAVVGLTQSSKDINLHKYSNLKRLRHGKPRLRRSISLQQTKILQEFFFHRDLRLLTTRHAHLGKIWAWPLLWTMFVYAALVFFLQEPGWCWLMMQAESPWSYSLTAGLPLEDLPHIIWHSVTEFSGDFIRFILFTVTNNNRQSPR